MFDGRINSKASSMNIINQREKRQKIFQWHRRWRHRRQRWWWYTAFHCYFFPFVKKQTTTSIVRIYPFIRVEWRSIMACKASYFFNPFMIFSVFLSPTLQCKCKMVYRGESVQFIFSQHINMLSGCYHISHFTNLLQMRWTSANV